MSEGGVNISEGMLNLETLNTRRAESLVWKSLCY